MTRQTTVIVAILTLSALLATSMYAYEPSSSVPVARLVQTAAVQTAARRSTTGRRQRMRNIFLAPFKPLVRWSKKMLLRGSRKNEHKQTLNNQDNVSTTHHVSHPTDNDNNNSLVSMQRFVDTVHSPIGGIVLRRLFPATDQNRDGKVDAHELQTAFDNLNIQGIDAKEVVNQSDLNQNGGIDLSEWLSEAPRTLRAFVQTARF